MALMCVACYYDVLAWCHSETGGLLRLAVKLMQACSPSTEYACRMCVKHNGPTCLHRRRDFVPLVNVLGTLYQIRDDYVNLCSEEV